MAGNESTRQWQVTCVCGWRTLGTKGEVVSAVIGHGKDEVDPENRTGG